MRSPREILMSLVDAAMDVEGAMDSFSYDQIMAAAAKLKAALADARNELNQTHQLVIFISGGKVTRAITDVDTNMSCMVINWDIDSSNRIYDTIDEITWSSTQTKTGKLLTDHLSCEVDPVIVSDVARTFEAQRLKAMSELRNWKPFGSI